jgi:hypothetical protein
MRLPHSPTASGVKLPIHEKSTTYFIHLYNISLCNYRDVFH